MPMRLGMLGMWHVHSTGIVRQVAAHPTEFQLAAFYDRDPELVARRRAEWTPLVGSMHTFDTPEALTREPLDGIVVEGRIHENLDLASIALNAGKPVLLEKPAGIDIDSFRAVHQLAESKRLHLQVLYLFRYMSAVRDMLARVRAGEIGSIYHYRARLPKDRSLYADYVRELSQYGGGMFFEMAGHLVDFMVTMLGTPTNVTPFVRHHHESDASNFIDNGLAVFEYPHALGCIEVTALECVPDARRIEVFGTEGGIVIPHLGSGHLTNDATQPIQVYHRGDAGWQTLPLPQATLQIADLREFAAVVRGEKPPEYTLVHDILVQEVLLRACGMLR